MQEIATEREEVRNVDPRTTCLEEFQSWESERKVKGDKLVVMVDANQSLADTKENYNIRDLVDRCDLTSTMECKHPGESLKLLDRGSKMIDHILVSGIDDEEITQAGQLPFGLGFHTDHMGRFVDMNGDRILK